VAVPPVLPAVATMRDESTLGVLPWSFLICYRPPHDKATLQVSYAEHDAIVKRGDFKQFRYYPQVPHVCVAGDTSDVLRLPSISAAVGESIVDATQPCRLELLIEHVSKAFATESEANRRAADSVEDVPYGRMRLIRIEFDDIDAFMRATLQPARSIGWLGMARNGTSRLAIPLIMAEAPMNHTNNLEGGLKRLFRRTKSAVRKAVRGPHHHLLCLGTLLFSANIFYILLFLLVTAVQTKPFCQHERCVPFVSRAAHTRTCVCCFVFIFARNVHARLCLYKHT